MPHMYIFTKVVLSLQQILERYKINGGYHVHSYIYNIEPTVKKENPLNPYNTTTMLYTK